MKYKIFVSERQILFLVIILLLLTNVLFFLEARSTISYANNVISEYNELIDSNYCVFPEKELILNDDFNIFKKVG